MIRVEIYYDTQQRFMPKDQEVRNLQDWCLEEAEEYIKDRQGLLGFKRAFIYLVDGKDRIELRKYLPL